MMICPVCATTVPVQDRDCPACRVGLAEYAAIWYLPDQLFNEGVVQLRRGDATAAATLFAQVCWFRPDDVDARRAWAHACSMLGRHEEAVLILGDAMERAPNPDVEEQYAEALAAAHHGDAVAIRPEPGAPERVKPVAKAQIRRKKSRSARKRHR